MTTTTRKLGSTQLLVMTALMAGGYVAFGAMANAGTLCNSTGAVVRSNVRWSVINGLLDRKMVRYYEGTDKHWASDRIIATPAFLNR